jgi:hypothetical protein
MNMARLKDTYLSDVQPGELIYPSSSARKSGHGGYLLDGETRCVGNDSEIFPAIVINPHRGLLATPTGMKALSKHSLISVMK